MPFSITISPPKNWAGITLIANEEQSQGQMKQIINFGSHFLKSFPDARSQGFEGGAAVAKCQSG